MISRRTVIGLVLSTALVGSLPAKASEAEFTQEGFAAAQKAGKMILVDVWASWCPTCKAQAPILSSILKSDKNIALFRVNFDTQGDVLAAFGVQQQSTLIMFKGDKETARSVGDTDAGSIAALVASAK
jgi:thioredoxin 1